jgi:hypothetical protein
LSISGNAISGTPTAAGTFNIAIRATNAGGYDEKTFSIVVAAAVVPSEALLYWGHVINDGSEPVETTITNYLNWFVENGYLESSSITGTVKEIRYGNNTGYTVILIPQSAGIPARIDDAGGINIIGTTFTPVKNITLNGMPYYLYIGDDMVTSTGFTLTIRW